MGLLQWVSRPRAGLIAAIGYATAAVIAITVFVYLTFPRQQLSDWIRVKIERAAGLEISVRTSRVRFPFRLVWNGVTVRRPGPVAPVLGRMPTTWVGRMPTTWVWTAEQVSVGWPLGAILQRQLDLDLGLQGLGGEARGRVTARRTPRGMKYHLEATGKGFDLGKLAAGFQLPSRDVSGAVEVNRLEHDWVNGDVLQGQGLLVLEANEVELKSLETRFVRINGILSLKGGMGHLENFAAQGDALDLVGSGSLLLRPDFMESLLNFNSRVTLRKPTGPLALLSAMASPDGHLDFALRGTLRRPTPYLNGTPMGAIGAGGSGLPIVGERPVESPQRAGEPPRLPVAPGGPGE